MIFALILQLLLVLILVGSAVAAVWLIRRFTQATTIARESTDWLTAHTIVAGILESQPEATPLTTAALAQMVSEPQLADSSRLRHAVAAVKATTDSYESQEPELADQLRAAIRAHVQER